MKNVNLRIWISGVLVTAVLMVAFTNCGRSGFELSSSQVSSSSQILSSEDPFLPFAWHLQNTGQMTLASTPPRAGNDLNLQQTWQQGIYGRGVKIMISDDGVEDTHEDLTANFSYARESKDYTLAPPYLSTTAPHYDNQDDHGTAVAGLAAAAAFNGRGARGVAPRATLLSANFLSSRVVQNSARQVDQADGDFDILNMSWGAPQNTLSARDLSYETQLRFAAITKRRGLGTIFVKAAGNHFLVPCRNMPTQFCTGNSNFDADDANPYTIMVSSLAPNGSAASYSSPGSNIWISAMGGETGVANAAMITTDRAGCTLGNSRTNATSTLPFERGGSGNTNCNYSATFTGTSAAAPVTSGAIALLLEANPNLSWRDIKYLLARTATPVDFQTNTPIPHPLNNALPAGAVWELPWVVNQAGFRFHNWYGFGRLNVDAALALARNYVSPLGNYTETNFAHEQTGLTVAIPDNSAVGGSSTLTVNTSLRIEAAQIQLWVTHPDISELAIELTSPSGTRSLLVNMHNSLVGLPNYQGELMMTNAFYQENSQGTWTLKVIDGKFNQTGTLTRWRLNLVGGN